jgi:hypothetical protein
MAGDARCDDGLSAGKVFGDLASSGEIVLGVIRKRYGHHVAGVDQPWNLSLGELALVLDPRLVDVHAGYPTREK